MTARISSDSLQAPAATPEAPHIIRLLHEDAAAQRAQLRSGLFDAQAHTAPKFFYDPQGCSLFDAICELEEYYPTRTEQKIFEHYRAVIARHLPAGAQWIDLGCGNCAKSQPWLAPVSVQAYIGVDIAWQWLRDSLTRLAGEHPKLECLGVVADFTAPLDLHQVLAQRPCAAPVFFYPGSSIGNFPPTEALSFLASIREHLGTQGKLLIGVDLLKDQNRMEAAYDDALGVSAAFNRNVLRVVNRLLDADFDPAQFDHLAFFNAAESRIEMHLRARHAHAVRIDGDVRAFAAQETIQTEYSYKYSHDSFGELLNRAGFGEHHFWTDEQQDFGVFVAAA